MIVNMKTVANKSTLDEIVKLDSSLYYFHI